MRIDEFIAASNAAETQDEVYNLYAAALADLGYDRFIYAALRGQGADLPCILRNYPDDWMRTYVERGYGESDPVRLRGVQVRSPFVWTELMTSRLARPQRRVMDEAEEAGLHDGIGVPIHLAGGRVVGMGLASSLGGTDGGQHLTRIYVLSLQFHTVWTALSTPQTTSVPHLTRRELEVLKWCAVGKSNWMIGEIMSISEHGVHFHLRNILRKLQVDSRTTAVVKAYHLGLISL